MPKEKKPTHRTVKCSIADAVSTAFSEFEGLATEMEEVGDNLEEKFSQTSRYERIREAQEALEGLSEPSISDGLGKLQVEYPERLPTGKKGLSRADRLSNALLALDAVIEILGARENDEDAESVCDELENAKSDAEGVEFPGWTG